ncbi:carboxyl-terminal-processing peptidase 3, chloroplastic-like [Curcuma longa]|uniref:carboxyl-terminal-processing peptidase 3, chloroplastic-like n=1 Tax=Curcuma longa TaxID=136217 RepID=UPI003D9F6F43
MESLIGAKPDLALQRPVPLSRFSNPVSGAGAFPVPRRIIGGSKLRAVPVKKSESGCEVEGSGRTSPRLLEKAASGFAAAAAAAAVICACGCDAPALAESLTVAFPVSRAREVNTVQRTLVEAWGLIRETFIDPTFNHQDWDLKLQQTMVEMFPLKSEDAAYSKISGMLATLGDPFTRIISPKEYQSFRIGSDGNLQGVGLFINVEPKSGNLVVESLPVCFPFY